MCPASARFISTYTIEIGSSCCRGSSLGPKVSVIRLVAMIPFG